MKAVRYIKWFYRLKFVKDIQGGHKKLKKQPG